MATRPPTKGVLFTATRSMPPSARDRVRRNLVEFRDLLAELYQQLLELVPVEVQQVLHTVEPGGGVEFLGVVEVVPRVVDDGLDRLVLLRGLGDLGVQVGQAVHRVDAGQVQPLEVSTRNLHADQARAGWAPGARLTRLGRQAHRG